MTSEIAAATDSPVPLAPTELSRIAQDLQIRRTQVEHVVKLLDAGNSIPFITRYCKEQTGGLPEMPLRLIHERVQRVRAFTDRQQTILKSIEAQGKLTDELKAAILAADYPRRLEDLFLPFKPKKKSLAGEARDRGLEPLALAIWTNDPVAANLPDLLTGMLNPEKQINTAEEALLGTKNIIIEMIAEHADLRSAVRRCLWDISNLTAGRHERLPEGKGLEYKDYFQYSEPVQLVPSNRILALNRGERENALAVRLQFDRDILRKVAAEALPTWAEHTHREVLDSCLDEALVKTVLPALERELRRELTEVAQRHAIDVFARNLHGLLMQPPLPGKRVLAIDPGFRPGCRLCLLDEHGMPVEDGIIFPHMPQKQRAEAKLILEKFIRKHQPSLIAIGNGSACRETEELVSEVIGICEKRRRGELVPDDTNEQSLPARKKETTAADPTVVTAPEGVIFTATESSAEAGTAPIAEASATPATPEAAATEEPAKPAGPSPVELLKAEVAALPNAPTDLFYVIVNEAGAADYSASAVGREEFPQYDTSLRGTISIGRRLQDPLGELVKIDPQHVGVGLYQHDVHGKQLKAALEAVVESCVNHVGVDVNSANVSLLRYVAGFNALVARDLVEHRQKNGPFKTLDQLTAVGSISPERYRQAAGFLRIPNGEEPLDFTTIHPEHYVLARSVLEEVGFSPADLRSTDRLKEFREKVAPIQPNQLAQKHGVIEPLIWELLDALTQPGCDPRMDLPMPIFRREVLKIEDLKPGMELKGTVLNVVDFGAFVDVGLKDSGLVHISQLANRYVRNPHELVSVGDVVKVWVMEVNTERRRVSLTMIEPGTPRKQEEPPPRSFAPRGARPQQREDRQREPAGVQQDRPRRQPRRPQRNENVEVVAMEGPLPPRNTARFERKPPRPPKPLPTLSKEKKEGKAYLNTLGELEAFFKQRDAGEQPQG